MGRFDVFHGSGWSRNGTMVSGMLQILFMLMPWRPEIWPSDGSHRRFVVWSVLSRLQTHSFIRCTYTVRACGAGSFSGVGGVLRGLTGLRLLCRHDAVFGGNLHSFNSIHDCIGDFHPPSFQVEEVNLFRGFRANSINMSEYWKSTNRYWCKHCSTFVRDTKLERANHEATGKHQGAVKRALRDLHRNADQKERDKDRAKREVDRLNGVVSGTSTGTSGASRFGTKPGSGGHSAPAQEASQAERQKQLEQLADLGVNIPTELRGDMAMAGEWTVTATKVVNPNKTAEDNDTAAADGRATGVKRERERTEEEKEQEDAIKGLFKKRKWGVDSKTMPADEDAEL